MSFNMEEFSFVRAIIKVFTVLNKHALYS